MRKLLALLLIVASPSATAKCAVQSYLLEGLVVDSHGAAASGAMVGVAWTKLGSPQGPVITLTNADGQYSLPIHFDTWSGMSELGDDCDAELREVSVSAYTLTGYALREIVAVVRQEQIIVPVLRVTQEIQ